ncbi:MAG: glycosyltransferase family 2 protein [Candidatus Eremiobacteraeota bacterium]|nr:glycosyltransferase family 2 protein [Candidatus Eremiobacteraeota bacterium]
MDRSAFTLVVPTFNEAIGIHVTLAELTAAAAALRERYDGVELLLVDDGSSDGTPDMIRRYAADHPGSLELVEHERNAGLVAAMRTGAERARYETVVFLDADLSYRPEIAGPLVDALRGSGASAALASPYMAGGRVANVPFVRLAASRVANWLLTGCAAGRLHTFTGMVRAYDRAAFVGLFATLPEGEFNAWAVAMLIAGGRTVVEIPAALVWPAERVTSPSRLSLGSLWDRTLLVAKTVSILVEAMRLDARRANLGTLVLGSPSPRPCASDS